MGIKKQGRALLRIGVGIAVGLAGLAASSPLNAGAATGGGGPVAVSVMGTGDSKTLNVMQSLDFLYLYSPGCQQLAPTGTTQWLDFSCLAPDPAGTITTENYEHDQVHQAPAVSPAPADTSDLGISELCAVTRPAGVDYARSSRGPKATDCAGLKFVAYANNAFNVYCTASCPGGASSTATTNYISEQTGWICKQSASHAVNPVTGNNYRTDIAGAITAAGYAPLPLGVIGGGNTNSSFCRLQAVTGVTALAANTSAVVSWTPYTPASGDPAATGYTITASTTGTGTVPAPTVVSGASTGSAIITGLTNSLAEPSHAGYTFSVGPNFAAGNGGAIPTTSPIYPQVVVGEYTAVTPARILETRSGIASGQCTPSPCATFGTGAVKVQVSGQGGIPASGVNAVVVNITVTNPTQATYLTVWPDDQTEPNASTHNYSAGQTIPNLVTVKLGADGGINIRNHAGTTDVLADVAGWYSDGTPTPGNTAAIAGSRYNPLTPARILETRSGIASGRCTPSPCATFGTSTVKLQVGGQGGVPAGASAVVLNMTVTNPTQGTYLSVWPDDATEPNASVLNYGAGQTIPNLVTVKLGADGGINIRSHAGTVDVIADAAGSYAQAGGIAGTRFVPVAPVRILDSRGGVNIGTCNGGACTTFGTTPVAVQVAGQGTGGVPASGATAVVMNVTVTNPTQGSYLTVWPSDATQPTASNLNYTAGTTIPNLVNVKLGGTGAVKIFNASGAVDTIADVAGWFNDGTS